MVAAGLAGNERGEGAPDAATSRPAETTRLQLPPRSEPLGKELCASLGLTEAGATIVNRIRSGDPVRRPTPGGQNWAGAEYLDLMGFTVGVESRTVERAYYRLLPRRAGLLEVFDQPYMLRRVVKRLDGSFMPPADHVPDALCIEVDRVYFNECKLWSALVASQEKYPDKFCLRDDGRWHSPAAERALEGTGIGYEVWTDRDINPTLLRNVNFLRDYERQSKPSADDVAPVVACLAKHPYKTLDDVFTDVPNRQLVYLAIAHGFVYFDVARDLVNEDRSPVFGNETAWRANEVLRRKPARGAVEAPLFCPEPGAPCTYDGQEASIVSADARGIWIRTKDGDCTYLTTEEVLKLAPAGKFVWRRENMPMLALARAQLKEATTECLESALATYASIEPWLLQGKTGGTSRTQRRNTQKFRIAEGIFGHGLVGLLDRKRMRGNRNGRLSEQQELTIDKLVQAQHLDNARSIEGTLALINPELEKLGEVRISRKALTRRINRIPKEERERRRHGHRMANAARAPHSLTDQPAKGERAFEVGMIDSFSVPMKTRSRRTGQVIETPLWGTLLWNVHPPHPLGLALQFEKPSTRSVMAAVRDCVRRFHRLPDNIYCDLGGEHGGLTFDLMRAEYKVDFLQRPSGNARFGTDIEAHIGAFKEKVREYRGSYKRIPRRGGSASHSPDATSAWYWDDFDEDFREFVFVDWPEMEHEGIATKPALLLAKSIAEQGERPTRIIPYDENFIVLTMPIVKAAAKINPTRGVRFDYVWYHNPALDDERWHKEPVTLRAPVDESYIIVQLGANWVRCDPVSYVFRLFSHREQALLLEEWRGESRQSNSKERLNPESFERFMTRIAEKEGQFEQAAAAAAAEAPNDEATPAVDETPTSKEEVDDFTFTAAPVL